jgi:hypothetical protein
MHHPRWKYITWLPVSWAGGTWGACHCSCITPLLDLSATPNLSPLVPKHKYARYDARLPAARADITVVACIRHDGECHWRECITHSPLPIHNHNHNQEEGQMSAQSQLRWARLLDFGPCCPNSMDVSYSCESSNQVPHQECNHTKPEPPNPTYTPTSQPLKQWVPSRSNF